MGRSVPSSMNRILKLPTRRNVTTFRIKYAKMFLRSNVIKCMTNNASRFPNRIARLPTEKPVPPLTRRFATPSTAKSAGMSTRRFASPLDTDMRSSVVMSHRLSAAMFPSRSVTRNPQVCHDVPEQQCHTVYAQECHDVPRTECQTSYQKQCHPTTRRECQDVPSQQCHQVPRQQCHDVTTQNCQQVPKKDCHQKPKKNCHKVPKVKQSLHGD